MRMKKSQLKEAVKAVVRQCLNERSIGGKAKRLKEGMGNDASQSPMDDIVKHVIKKVPAIASNPDKVARVSTLLFQRQFGGQQPPDQETLLGLVQKHMNAGHAPEGQAECGGMEEAGLTSENGGYDENEEIMLIKVMALIAKKLEAMHAGEGASPVGEPEEEPSAPPFGGEEEPSEEPSEEPEGGNPFGKEDEPSEEPEEPSEPEDDEKEEEPVKEAAYKQVAPRAATDAKEDKARRIQTEPKVNETTVTKAGPQYKTQSPRQARVQSDDQARTIQFDPKMTEVKKKVKENHKVQARSYKTVADQDNDPENVRDPEVPQS